MNGSRPAYCGAILAGGQSRRMGRPKMFMELPDGRPMFQVVGDTLGAVCRQVVLAGSPPADSRSLPYMYVPDLSPGKGPLAGIEALLLSGLSPAYLVAACDQPLLTPELLNRLRQGDEKRAKFFFDPVRAIIHALPAYVPEGLLGELQRTMASGRNSIHAFAEAAGPDLVILPPEDKWQLTNINTPDDYRELVHHLWSTHAAAR